ncbi:hypothetical protein ACLOJK_013285 [Asimina triloba]
MENIISVGKGREERHVVQSGEVKKQVPKAASVAGEREDGGSVGDDEERVLTVMVPKKEVKKANVRAIEISN